MTHKVCSKCKENKRVFDFHQNGFKKNGDPKYRAFCKKCRNESHRVYVNNNKEQIKSRSHYNYKHVISSKYGLTKEFHDNMQRSQNGVCAICGKEDITGMVLSVDHDHDTGLVRTLLCGRCNSALGLLQDSPDIAMKAAMYLTKHKGKDF